MALAVSLSLTLPIALDGCRVGLPVLAGIIGISPTPFLLAVQADLAVTFPAALPLAIRLAANKLVRMITGKLKDLVAVATMAITHQIAPNWDASH